MHEKSSQTTIHRAFIIAGFIILSVSFAISAIAEPWDHSDWKQWTAKDVHEVLYKSPWVSNCCREWAFTQSSDVGGTASLGYSASIVSSVAVREALVRRMEFDEHYDKLDLAGRQAVDHRIAACLNQRFDDQMVISFSFDMSHDPVFNTTSDISNSIHLVTSDGRKVAGHVVSDSIAKKCGGLSKDLNPSANGPILVWALYGPNHELAFSRFADGKPTITPNDKTIRIDLDFHRISWPGHYSVADTEIEFRIDKLVYQGKPDF